MEYWLIRLAAALLLNCGTGAEAAFELRDSRFGAGTIVHDTETGLQWLQPQVAAGVSWMDLWPQVTPGGTYDGFMFASQDDVASLFMGQGLMGLQATDEGVAGAAALRDAFGAVRSGMIAAPWFSTDERPYAHIWLGYLDSGTYYDDSVIHNVFVGSPTIGAWLVATPVPEPTMGCLLLGGLLFAIRIPLRRR